MEFTLRNQQVGFVLIFAESSSNNAGCETTDLAQNANDAVFGHILVSALAEVMLLKVCARDD